MKMVLHRPKIKLIFAVSGNVSTTKLESPMHNEGLCCLLVNVNIMH